MTDIRLPSTPPWNEADRLAALQSYRILDTPADEEFDSITRVASIVCQAPVALVSFVADNRQWFKSRHGLDARETPMSQSICARALVGPSVTVIPDTRVDPRSAENPLVTGEPHLMFYAGARLETPEGFPLGTVCVLDYKPRPQGLTHDQQEVLLALSRQAMAHLELRRALDARDLLSRELHHRVKNIFAVVGGLVSLSARSDPAAKPFAQSFQARLQALATAQDFARPAQADAPASAPGTLTELIRVVLAPYREDTRERFTITGDDVPVGPTAATPLALILHEQATNAVKYGSLSNDTGHVELRGQDNGTTFVLTWTELGGPELDGEPERRGFGTQMAGRAVSAQLNGSVTYDWAPSGLVMTLTASRAALAR